MFFGLKWAKSDIKIFDEIGSTRTIVPSQQYKLDHVEILDLMRLMRKKRRLCQRSKKKQ